MPECHRLCTISRQFSRSCPRRHSVLRPCTAEYSEILLNSAVGPCLPWTYTSVKISAWWTSFEGTQRARLLNGGGLPGSPWNRFWKDTAIGNITTANKRHAVLCKLEWALIRQADRQTDGIWHDPLFSASFTVQRAPRNASLIPFPTNARQRALACTLHVFFPLRRGAWVVS